MFGLSASPGVNPGRPAQRKIRGMFAADLRVLSLIVACSTVLLVIGLRLLERVSDDVPLIRTWTAGAIQWIGGFVLLGLRDLIPMAASVVLGNVLVVTGACWLYYGLCMSLQLPRGRRWDYALGTLTAAGLIASTYPEVILWARVAVVSGISTVISAAGVVVIVRTRRIWRSETRRLPWLLGGVLGVNAALLALRTTRALLDPANVTFDNLNTTLRLSLATIIVINAVMTLAVMALMAARIQERLSRHGDELERQVNEKTAQLRTALAASEAANVAKTTFLEIGRAHV
jgi:hypothetical protein